MGKIRIDLGCGRKKVAGHIGIDIIDSPGVDIVHDLNNGIPLPDDYADSIIANQVLEHIRRDRLVFIMNEIHRVLVPGGVVTISVPHHLGKWMASDPTHLGPGFGEFSMHYFTRGFVEDFSDYGIRGFFKILRQETSFAPYVIDGEVWQQRWPDGITWVLEKD